MTRQRVVIVGAGFAGLALARKLAGKSVDVLLLNRDNYQTFSPLLHHVATGAIAPSNVIYSLRRAIHKAKNIRVLTATVTRVNLRKQFVETENYAIAYDYLAIACGCNTHYGHVFGAREYAFPLKNIHDAVNLRNQILTCFEHAQAQTDKFHTSQLLTFCVVGAGATGVELAAELADLIRGSLAKDYPGVDLRRVRIVLLQRGERILSELSSPSANYVLRQLQAMGVEVRLNAHVCRVTGDALHLEDGRVIPTKTVIWTAGVSHHADLEKWGLTKEDCQGVQVLPTLQHCKQHNLYMIGDIAASSLQLPMVASSAIAQGICAGENILRQLQGRNPQPFHYQHPGTMVVLGRNAVVEIGKIRLSGFMAWLLWLQVHLVYLPGNKNRIQVLLNWIFSYILRDRPIKSILTNHPSMQLNTNHNYHDELEAG